MAPINQEEQMKDKLEKRCLQPSPESWATLANRLDTQEKMKNRSLFWWYGIAASVVGILFVTVMYFSSKPFENSTPIIVDTHEKIIQEKGNENEHQILEIPTHPDQVIAEEEKATNTYSNRAISEGKERTTTTQKNTIVEQPPQHDAIAEVQEYKSQNAVNSTNVENLTEVKKLPLTFEEQKIQDVVAQINNLKANGNPVTDTEIDSLLKKAQKEILSNRLYNENIRTVDANVLLQDVEDDLQQSFRSKVFEALQSGYESVRTAVAERNN